MRICIYVHIALVNAGTLRVGDATFGNSWGFVGL